MKDLTGLSVVIPVYNEDIVKLNELYKKLRHLGAEVLVVDDGSDEVLPYYLNPIRHPKNMGYGRALKTGIHYAKNNIIATMDSDGQHTIEDIIKLYTVYKASGCKMIIGSRWELKESALRFLGRKVLNFIASVISGHYMIDLNSGIRVFDRELAIAYEQILCDVFSYTTSITMSFVSDQYRVAWIPINVQPRNSGKSKVKVVKDGLITLRYIVVNGLAIRTRGLRAWMRSKRGR